ncbi:MAG TPA: hypothetical protein QGF58_23320 [Myxococcota bacterium]|nr:hypothetical protein [Myxococcota bacterium]
MTLALLFACAKGSLEITPNPLSWGEVDFHAGENCEDDEGGCSPLDVVLRNAGDADLELTSAQGYDSTYLCIDGYAADAPMELGDLPPGASSILTISVCGYQPGELTSEVSGSIVFELETGDESLDWSFTPIRNIDGDDTGT